MIVDQSYLLRVPHARMLPGLPLIVHKDRMLSMLLRALVV